MVDELSDRELTFNRFRRLVRELSRGETPRNSFEAWEVEILLDLEQCAIKASRRMELLTQYERAVRRQLMLGDGPPMKLSEFLEERRRRREERKSEG
jgi:hypothetical protein